MEDYSRAFYVAKKFDSQTLAGRSAFDKAGNVSQNNVVINS